MRYAAIILPLFDNDGVSLADIHSDLRTDLAESFGGYTAREVTGGWRDESTGVVYEDSSIEYVIAQDWIGGKLALLDSIAESYCDSARQLALCVTYPDGLVSFVYPAGKAPAQAAPSYEESAPVSFGERRERDRARSRSRAAERAFKYATR